MEVNEMTTLDFDGWIGLRHDLWPYHTLDELKGEARELWMRLDTDYMFYAARDKGKMIGFIEVSLRDSAPGCNTKNVGYIEGWYVEPTYRRMGVGRQLVERGEAWARGKGCREMASDTTPRYPVSPAAHHALGYEDTEEPLCFRKSLCVEVHEIE